jgi:hypothetical protein
MGDFKILTDIKGLGISDLFNVYAQINQQNINKGIAKSQNFLNELNAQADLYRAKNGVITKSTGLLNPNAKTDWAKYGLIAVVVLVAGYVLVKK